jgi:folate-binding protein YgfZ
VPLRSTDFREQLDALEAEWDPRDGTPVVRHFGDPDSEYEAVQTEAGLADRSERETLVVSGDDAIQWLQGLVTNDLHDLVELGSGQWNCATDVNGRMVADMRLLHLPNMLLLDLEPGTAEGLKSHLSQQIILEDADLANQTESTGRIGVFGPRAADVVGSAFRLDDDPSGLAPFDATWGASDATGEVIVQRIEWTEGLGFDLIFDRHQSARVWEQLQSVGGDSLEPVGDETLETCRIEAGIPRFGVETSDDVIPLEADLQHIISFDKGCYVGQEIIARLDTRGTPAKRLRTLVFEGGAAPAPEADVEDVDGNRSVGEVVSAVWSPRLQAPIALAYVKRRHNDVGTTVRVEGREAEVHRLGHPLRDGEANAA